MKSETAQKTEQPELTLAMAKRFMEKHEKYFEEKGLTPKGNLLQNQNPAAMMAAVNASKRGG